MTRSQSGHGSCHLKAHAEGSQLLGAWAKRTLELLGCPDSALAAELNGLYLRHRFADIELYRDVLPCLDALQSHYLLGLLSNGNAYPERCGLSGRFRFVVFAQDVGVAKPGAAMFHAACQQAGCIPCELVHVGDSLETDVAGANAIGAASVWLNRQGTQNRTAITPDAEIRSLEELPRVLAAMTKASNNRMHPTRCAGG
jgi:HAD superfamily hydrolase (TIGR01509 family)